MTDGLDHIGKRLGSLDDLPEALRSQLQTGKPDEMAEQIMKVMETRYDGIATIDEILVGYYRDTTQVLKRPFLANKLYRMAASKLIYSVPKKKGVYSTTERSL